MNKRSSLAALLAASLGALAGGGCEPIGDDAAPIEEPPPAPPAAPGTVPTPTAPPTSDPITTVRSAVTQPSAIGRLYFKYNGQIAVGIDVNGNMFSPSTDQGAVGGTPFTSFPGLVFKHSGTALYGFERSSTANPPDIDQLGRIMVRNNYLVEIVPTLPLPGETGVLMLKNAGVGLGEFDHLDNGGSFLIHGQLSRFFKYRKDAMSLTPVERANFVAGILYLNGQRYGSTSTPKDGCGAVANQLDGNGNSIPYRLPGNVSYYAKSDEAHANTKSHNNRNLLPWHREFLAHIEGQLRAYDPTISIPYWNWSTTPHGLLMYPVMDGFMGHPNNTVCGKNASGIASNDGVTCVPDGDGPTYGWAGLDDSNPNNTLDMPWYNPDTQHPVAGALYDPTCSMGCQGMTTVDPCAPPPGYSCPNPCRENTLTASWNTAFSPHGISQWFSMDFFNPGASDAELAAMPSYDQLADEMNVIHGDVHFFLGHFVGDLQPFETSARVPLLYLMHANIDRLWESWQNAKDANGVLIEPRRSDPSWPQYAFGAYWNTPANGETIEGVNSSLEPWADTPPAGGHYYRHSRPFLASDAECLAPPGKSAADCSGETYLNDVKTSYDVLTPPLYQ